MLQERSPSQQPGTKTTFKKRGNGVLTQLLMVISTFDQNRHLCRIIIASLRRFATFRLHIWQASQKRAFPPLPSSSCLRQGSRFPKVLIVLGFDGYGRREIVWRIENPCPCVVCPKCEKGKRLYKAFASDMVPEENTERTSEIESEVLGRQFCRYC